MMKYILTITILFLLTGITVPAQTFSLEEQQQDLRVLVNLACELSEDAKKLESRPEDGQLIEKIEKKAAQLQSFISQLEEKYENHREQPRDSLLIEWLEKEMKKCDALTDFINLEDLFQRFTPVDNEEMKANIKRSIDLTCLYYEANLKSLKAPEDTRLREEVEKRREEMKVFDERMEMKYKNAKPADELIRWAEEEMKKCIALEATAKFHEEHR